MAEYILQVKDLHFWYGEIHALKGISLNVEKNGVVSLLGANGAGKTSLLESIAIAMSTMFTAFDGAKAMNI